MRVVYSAEATADLVEIGGYIALDSESQAEAFVAKLGKGSCASLRCHASIAYETIYYRN